MAIVTIEDEWELVCNIRLVPFSMTLTQTDDRRSMVNYLKHAAIYGHMQSIGLIAQKQETTA